MASAAEDWHARSSLFSTALQRTCMTSTASVIHRRTVVSLDWRIYAFGSAAFAALTAIFGKVGVDEINSDLATFIRTVVILVVSAALVSARGEWQSPDTLSSKG